MKIRELSDIELLKMFRIWRDLTAKSVSDEIFFSKLEAEVVKRENKNDVRLCHYLD